MKIHVSELEGRALDWAVAKATCPQSFRNSCNDDGLPYWSEGWLLKGSPSTDWGQCGPLMDEHKITVDYLPDGTCRAWIMDGGEWTKYCRTAPISVCRAIVAAKLGEEVEIPDELVG